MEGIFEDHCRVQNHQGVVVEYRRGMLVSFREFHDLRSLVAFNPHAGTVTLLTPTRGVVTFGESESVEANLDDLRAAIWDADLAPKPRPKRAKKN